MFATLSDATLPRHALVPIPTVPTTRGCPQCRARFIDAARRVHGDRYDYSQVEYINSSTKVRIVCSDHGVFQQTPVNHRNGRGCPVCRESKGERAVRRALMAAGIEFVAQWRPPGCEMERQLAFDFYLPGLGVVIEFDGEFHRQVVRWPGQSEADALAAFEAVRVRDVFKDGWVRAAGLRMVRVGRVEDVVGVVAGLVG